ncbi:hypothetical protein ICN48_06890 [Polynucleobacter sp. JS-Safj-400b-B2]|uniref:hypothetical protein n=1 Tax=Polynucleobacter sp. JS-Safj-400b-B2 TaxID=2576921 RepID=UPI001C0B0EE4|nr:hypothetical protein [Polynucleobacter sp. JS-Safj-400b-B2]MBU3625959.1 hypothetical protein [Polynucleobacter sp. JS-Safj-400b-B2]
MKATSISFFGPMFLAMTLFSGAASADKCHEPDKLTKNNAEQYAVRISIMENGIIDSDFTILTLADGRKGITQTGQTIGYLDSSLSTVEAGGVAHESSHYKDLQVGNTIWTSLERGDRLDNRHLNLKFEMLTSKLLSMKDVRVGDLTVQVPTVESTRIESNLVVTLDEEIAIANDINGHHKEVLIKVSKVN